MIHGARKTTSSSKRGGEITREERRCPNARGLATAFGLGKIGHDEVTRRVFRGGPEAANLLDFKFRWLRAWWC